MSSRALSAVSVGFLRIGLVLMIGGSLLSPLSGDWVGDRARDEPSKSGGSCSSYMVSVRGAVSLLLLYSRILSSVVSEKASSMEKSVLF